MKSLFIDLGNILISFAPSLITDAMKIGFLVSIVFSFPLCVLPCRTSLYSLIYGGSLSDHAKGLSYSAIIPESRFKFLTTFIVAATLIVGAYKQSLNFFTTQLSQCKFGLGV